MLNLLLADILKTRCFRTGALDRGWKRTETTLRVLDQWSRLEMEGSEAGLMGMSIDLLRLVVTKGCCW
jgi:hypothetical protein